MPLPTYEQSEKYETEGVLDYHQHEREEEEEEMDRTVEIPQMVAGTWCEFLLFFLGEPLLHMCCIDLCMCYKLLTYVLIYMCYIDLCTL